MNESCGPPFKFLACRVELKEHPKFDLLLHPPASPTPTPSANENHDTDDTNDEDDKEQKEEYKRPMRPKRAKAADARADVDAKKLKLAEASLATLQKKNQLIEEHHEIMLFTAKTDDSDPVVRQYMQIKRRRALDRLLASETGQANDETPPPAPPSSNQ